MTAHPGTPAPRPAPSAAARLRAPEHAPALHTAARAVPPPPAPSVLPRGRSADPVKELLVRHRDLCARAVDPLEVAVGLEAAGFTERTAAGYRHRDVFALAEEMYARTSGAGDACPPDGALGGQGPLSDLGDLGDLSDQSDLSDLGDPGVMGGPDTSGAPRAPRAPGAPGAPGARGKRSTRLRTGARRFRVARPGVPATSAAAGGSSPAGAPEVPSAEEVTDAAAGARASTGADGAIPAGAEVSVGIGGTAGAAEPARDPGAATVPQAVATAQAARAPEAARAGRSPWTGRNPRASASRTSGIAGIAGISRTSVAWVAGALLPGTGCGLALVGLLLTDGWPRVAVALCGVLAVTAALCAAVRYGPLRTAGRRAGRPAALLRWGTRASVGLLTGYALTGAALLRGADTGGARGALHALGRAFGALQHGAPGDMPAWPTPPWAPPVLSPELPSSAVPLLALCAAVVPAACCARLFAAGAAHRMSRSRSLTGFTAAVRPLLAGTVALFLWALGILLVLAARLLDEHAAPGPYVAAGALGALLMTARLLGAYGFTRAPALLLAAACGAEMLAVAALCAARLPGGAVPAAVVRAAVSAGGPAVVPAAACSAAAVVLLAHALRTVTRASAHAPQAPARPPRPDRHTPTTH